MKRHRHIFKIFGLLAAGLMVSCQDDVIPTYDYSVWGEDVELTVPITLPEMDVKSRANISANQENEVQTLWISTYDAVRGHRTCAEDNGWLQLNPATFDSEVAHQATLRTKSGSSYIVAVANVDNYGISRKNPDVRRPLRELLAEAATWQDFLDIAVESPSTYAGMYSPELPLTMVGAYSNVKVGNHQTSLDSWQRENFMPYMIAESSNGRFTIAGDGAIHLRRLVSQITFNVNHGKDVSLTVNSFRVVNAPKYSWLYERTGNYGDAAVSEGDAANYYSAPVQYTGNTMINEVNGASTFNFWIGENKHDAIDGAVGTYTDRARQHKTDVVDSPTGQTKQNTGIFTSLSGQTWTPNNMATYVVLNCTVLHNSSLNLNDKGEQVTTGGSQLQRSGTGDIIVHLGYMNKNLNDFNSYRNTKYTYNVTVNGLNDIRLEAWNESERPDISGTVTDIEHANVELDCHYHAFNIELTPDDLKPWAMSNGESSGFGFIMINYDGNREIIVRESDYPEGTDVPADMMQYIDWVELRQTTGEAVLAKYKPRDGGDGLTFNLLDASRGLSSEQMNKKSNWYTVFVKEYTYEVDGGREDKWTDRPRWMDYVNNNPRRFYIRVKQSLSHDGESIYSRSKYGGVQRSIMTYYSRQPGSITQATTTGERGSAIGVERENESFGIALRMSYKGPSADNGRYNVWQWLQSKNNASRNWTSFIDDTKPQEIKKGNTGMASDLSVTNHNPVRLPKLANFTSSTNSNLWSKNNNTRNEHSPQGNSTTMSDYAEAINACMNRNRDNNGNGVIDPEELRWYVPTVSGYLQLTLGDASLDEPLMDYGNISALTPTTGQFSSLRTGGVGRYIFFGSDGNVLWAAEGLSTSEWCQWGATSPVAAWEVRCVRNLGTNLTTVDDGAKAVPAYTFTPTDGNMATKRGGVVRMNYYEEVSIRNEKFTGNGIGAAQLPVHLLSDRSNNSLYKAFEISDGSTQLKVNGSTREFYYDALTNVSSNNIADYVNSNPCKSLNTSAKGGWRLPNVKELAIMTDLGIIDQNLNAAMNNNHGFVLSASVSAFNMNTGSKATSVPTNTNRQYHYMMVARHNAVTQQQNVGTAFVRCVRDTD